MLNVTECDAPLTEADIKKAEAELGLTLPPAVRAHYLRWNGGRPDPYVYRHPRNGIVVSEFLSLEAPDPEDTAIATYRTLVIEDRMVAKSFFPFAVDPGGDYIFVDCDTADGQVFFYIGDTANDLDRLRAVGLGFDAFLAALEPEDD